MLFLNMHLTFTTQQTIAAQTNFVMHSLIQQSLLSFGLRQLILVCVIRKQSCSNAINVFDLNFIK